MKRSVVSGWLSGLLLLCCAASAPAQPKPDSHLDLDWQAPNRWVHVDNCDAGKARLFEQARLGWLRALRRDGHLLGDGRALFWHARSSAAGETFFSFYPYRDWDDLSARRAMIVRTQAAVGDSAVKAYDAGDAALVSPHYSQLWRRTADHDIAWSGTQALDELTAGAGRLEVCTLDIARWDEFVRAWRGVADALAAARYPLACRVWASSYGRGEYMFWWLAPDAAGCRAAPALREALTGQLGAARAAELLATLDRTRRVEETYELERRADMSNLGR
jgi:hypothetical protein